MLRYPTIGEATAIYASFVHPAMSHSTHCPGTAFGEASAGRPDRGRWNAATGCGARATRRGQVTPEEELTIRVEPRWSRRRPASRSVVRSVQYERPSNLN